MLSSPSLGWKRSRSFDPFGWLLVKTIARSAVGWHRGLGLTWRCRAGASAGAGGGAGVVSQPPSCRALPLPSSSSRQKPHGSVAPGGAAGARRGRGSGVPYSSRGSAQRAARAGCPRRNMFLLHAFISSPPCSDKYPFPHPKTCFCCFSKCFFFLRPL